MKRSATPTNQILVRAYNTNEYDETNNVNCAVINYTDNVKEIIEKATNATKAFKEDFGFLRIEFFAHSATFLYDKEDTFEELLGDDTYCFVEADEEELDTMSEEVERLDCMKVRVYREGEFDFQAYGKYSNVEFYTASFKVED